MLLLLFFAAAAGAQEAHTPAHDCVKLVGKYENATGGFRNSCAFPVNVAYCAWRPQPVVGVLPLDCERNEIGLARVAAQDARDAHTRTSTEIHWFACRGPAMPVNVGFTRDKGLEAACVVK